MSFAGKVWRLLVGIKDGLVLLFLLLFFGALFAVLTTRPSTAQVREGALLLNLDGFIVEERSPIDPFSAFLSGEAPVAEYQARDLVRALNTAATDARVKAVVLDLDRFLGGGAVHLQDVGEALDRVRQNKKPVLAFATLYSDDSYRLAAHASEVWVNPLGGAMLVGTGGKNVYFGGLLERLKVNARVYKVGTYKAAVEPFTLNQPSPEALENSRALYGALWEEWQANVRKARPRANIGLVANDPVAWLRAAGGDVGRASLSAGLVDKLGDRFAFEKRVAELVGDDAGSTGYAHSELQPWLDDVGPQTGGAGIGVVTIAGTIVDGEEGPGIAGGDRIADILDEALDDDLKGLVVRVDSPGGSVLASEAIRLAILRHKERRIPIAVSMANVAASGGYWVATPGDRIFAEPETITGSIGVFAILPTFERLAGDLGISTAGVGTTPLSGQPDFIGGFNEPTDQILQLGVEHTYADFLRRVSESRKVPLQRADAIGQGRVWDGGTARQIGLADQYGGLDDALAWVAQRAGLQQGAWHPVFLGEQVSSYDTLLRRWLVSDGTGETRAPRDIASFFAARERATVAMFARDLDRMLSVKGVQAYCLECPVSNRGERLTDDMPSGMLLRVVRLFTD